MSPITQSFWRGAAFIVLAEFFFTTMGVGIRSVAEELPNEMVVFARNLVGLLLLLPYLSRQGSLHLVTKIPELHLLRALAGVSAMYCFYYAIANIALAQAMLLKLTAPIFMPLIAIAWLREEVGPGLWLALGVGFAGVILIIDPTIGDGSFSLSPVALIGLLGGLLAALAKVTVRRLSATEPTTRIVFYFALIAGVISAVPLLWSWRTPSAHALLLLLGVGACATLGQLSLTRGLSLAPASRMGAFGYFAVVFGAAYGWLLWDELLSPTIIAGSLLVAAGGILVGRASTKPSADKASADKAPEARADLDTGASKPPDDRKQAPTPLDPTSF